MAIFLDLTNFPRLLNLGMTWIKCKGRVNVDTKTGRLVVDVSFDFVNYYNWLIMRRYWIKPSTPRYKAHVSVVLPTMHKVNLNNAKTWHGDVIEFEYDPNIMVGGKTKNFRNFWMKVRSPQIDAMKKVLGVKDDQNYRGLHLTISSTKSERGREVSGWWPEMIEIKNKDENSSSSSKNQEKVYTF